MSINYFFKEINDTQIYEFECQENIFFYSLSENDFHNFLEENKLQDYNNKIINTNLIKISDILKINNLFFLKYSKLKNENLTINLNYKNIIQKKLKMCYTSPDLTDFLIKSIFKFRNQEEIDIFIQMNQGTSIFNNDLIKNILNDYLTVHLISDLEILSDGCVSQISVDSEIKKQNLAKSIKNLKDFHEIFEIVNVFMDANEEVKNIVNESVLNKYSLDEYIKNEKISYKKLELDKNKIISLLGTETLKILGDFTKILQKINSFEKKPFNFYMSNYNNYVLNQVGEKEDFYPLIQEPLFIDEKNYDSFKSWLFYCLNALKEKENLNVEKVIYLFNSIKEKGSLNDSVETNNINKIKNKI